MLRFPHAVAQDAAQLRIAVPVMPTSLDPHFHDSYLSVQALLQIYEPLLLRDEKGVAGPGLAETCENVEELVWELKLRPNVKFHDGSPLVADDVKFSFERVPDVPNPPASFVPHIQNIAEIQVVDDSLLRFITKIPDPLFTYKISQIAILSRKIHTGATTADFTSGKVAIGTGAYRHVAMTPDEKLELEANPDHWAGTPEWSKVTFTRISDPGARIVAISTGEADLTSNVPVHEVARLSADPALNVATGPSLHMAYLSVDMMRDESPFVFGNDGKPLVPNPLKDLRVRQALSLSINRQALVERLLSGQGEVADQLVTTAVADRAENMPTLEYNVDKAKELLKDAGYPDGFRIAMQGFRGRFEGDTSVLQAAAQGFSRIGVTAEVEVMPSASFLTMSGKNELSMFIHTFPGADALTTLRFMAMTYNAEQGNGQSNRARYSNPKVDELMDAAIRTMDPAKRREITSEVMRLVVDDLPFIPLLFTRANWVMRKDTATYVPNAMSQTNALWAHRPA